MKGKQEGEEEVKHIIKYGVQHFSPIKKKLTNYLPHVTLTIICQFLYRPGKMAYADSFNVHKRNTPSPPPPSSH